MPSKNTPGVYIEEISTLPASVAAVPTAIPAFIGYTGKAEKNGVENSLINVPTRITSMLEYQELFGGAKPEQLVLKVTDVYDHNNSVIDTLISRTFSVTPPNPPSGYNLYYSLQMFFRNGGGTCYIVSIGIYDSSSFNEGEASPPSGFLGGIAALEVVDEPTLLVFPDAVNLTQTEYGNVVAASLAHCAKLQDRFTISDAVEITDSDKLDTGKLSLFRTAVGNSALKYGASYFPYLKSTLNYGIDASTLMVTYEAKDDTDAAFTTGTGDNPTLPTTGNLDSFRNDFPSIHRTLLAEIKKHYVTLPPSGAVAGIYARVDGDRGVWKAPANVSINSVIGPSIRLTNGDQDLLNVDASTGKSINAIRTFAGKGTLVWGARTLAGNDNEWRYVPVRRFFIFAEESIKKATEFVVFEPNDRNTWVRVKGMIENFLNAQWRAGALAGAKPEDAFFVKVGLGETMTTDDVLNGIMNVEIGMAAVRPAEFIILKFSHKLQES